MDGPQYYKECNRHENRADENDLLRICETCGRHFYLCEICRNAKYIDTPSSVCMKCVPALKTLRTVLARKESKINELQNRLKYLENDTRALDELKKQVDYLSQQKEEYRQQIRAHQDELDYSRNIYRKSNPDYDTLYEQLKPKQELSNNFKDLLTELDFADCQIVCGNQRYQAHRCILSARSDVLRKYLRDTNNKSKNLIDLSDLDQEIMPDLINYIYTAEENINDDNVDGLMKAAAHLNLIGLKINCLTYLENRLSRANVVPTLIRASQSNHERLKNKCLRFMFEEDINLTMNPIWNDFKRENPKLALEIYEIYIKDMNEYSSNNKNTNNNLVKSSNNLNNQTKILGKSKIIKTF